MSGLTINDLIFFDSGISDSSGVTGGSSKITLHDFLKDISIPIDYIDVKDTDYFSYSTSSSKGTKNSLKATASAFGSKGNMSVSTWTSGGY
ncbi:hypothetical protein H6F50_18105 [Coleofasciculus sp. FACHB-712]|uniref:hypothetical protein n=1 Tax=Coleofasciculus sp. FACHB-712 TaxID=2692789 RepID=UPI0016869128|nr:hypothetical protein [Coleofasciculus sp. FACHB-712]MBD1944247.1 hypothetical protein [Coleofasciculus sp. FACHB-712]